MAADLSAAAGALDAERPDIAVDLLTGAAGDLEALRRAAGRRPRDQALAAQLVGSPAPRPSRRQRGPSRLLAAALAVGLALIVLPGLVAGNARSTTDPLGERSTVVLAADRAKNLTLVSAEFTNLRTTLQSPHPTPSRVIAAGRKWQSTLSRTLPAASSVAEDAQHIVGLLRLERTVISRSVQLRAAEFASATTLLTDYSDSAFGTLRRLATRKVLAVLPEAITVLPALPVESDGTTQPASDIPAFAAPSPQPSPAPTTDAQSDAGTGTIAPASTAPSTGGDPLPSAAPASIPPDSLPLPDPVQAAPSPEPPQLPALSPLSNTGSQDAGQQDPLGLPLTGAFIAPG